jgi:hypothetical protein
MVMDARMSFINHILGNSLTGHLFTGKKKSLKNEPTLSMAPDLGRGKRKRLHLSEILGWSTQTLLVVKARLLIPGISLVYHRESCWETRCATGNLRSVEAEI